MPSTGYTIRAKRPRGASSGFGLAKPKSTKVTRLSGGPKVTTARTGFAPGSAKPLPPVRPTGHTAQPDSLYNDQVDLAERKESSALSQLDNRRQATRFDFGIDDPTNPNSRAEGLKRAFLQRFRGASAGIAAHGMLYSGAHERALARTRRDEETANAELRKAFEDAINSIGAAEAGVKFDTEEQKNQAFEDWLARAPESEGEVPAAAASGGTSGPSAPANPSQPSKATAPLKPVPSAPKPQGLAQEAPKGASTNRSIPSPVKGPDKTKAQAEKQLREKLKQARKNGNKKRVRRLRTRIKNMNRDQNVTRG